MSHTPLFSSRRSVYAALALLVLPTLSLQAQFVKRGVSLSLDYVASTEADVEGEGTSGRLSSDLLRAEIDWGRSIGEQTMLGATLGYEKIGFNFTGELPVPDELSKLELNMKLQHAFNRQWQGFVFVNPGFRGSGVLCADDAFGVVMGAGAAFRQNEKLSWIMGAGYEPLGKYQVIPVFGVRWQIDKDWVLNFGFPRTNLIYQASEKLRLTADLNAEVGSYWVERTPDYGTGSTVPAYEHERLAYRMFRFGLGADYSLSYNWSCTVKGGLAFGRVFDYYDVEGPGGDTQYDGDPTAFFAAGVNYSF